MGNPCAAIGIFYRNSIGINYIIIIPTGSVTLGVGNSWAAVGIFYRSSIGINCIGIIPTGSVTWGGQPVGSHRNTLYE